MTTNQTALWQKIAAYSLDDPHAAFPFSKKLEKEQGWSEAYTQRAIAEYKKFMFLCVDSPNGASPSQNVDEVWHLHLTYSADYACFCDTIAGRFIHHNPSKGGILQQKHHHDWHEDTLKNYMQAFDELPPTDIWAIPTDFYPPQYLSEKSAYTTIDSFGFEIYYKLMPHSFWIALSFLGAVDAVFMLFFNNPFKLTGPAFLSFLFPIALVTLVYQYLMTQSFKEMLRERFEEIESQLTTYHLAFLMGGKERVFQTLVLELGEAQVLQRSASGNHLEINDLSKFQNILRGHPMRSTLEAFTDKTLPTDYLRQIAGNLSRHIERNFDRLKLTYMPMFWQYGVYAAFLAFVGVRMVQGFAGGHPTFFLVAIAAVYAIVGWLLMFRDKERKAFYREVFQNRYLELPKEQQITEQYALNGQVALASVDLTTTTLLVGLVAMDWQDTPNDSEKENGDGGFFSGWSSSCGSGDGGGSSCGGGSCGGGCGGCGG